MYLKILIKQYMYMFIAKYAHLYKYLSSLRV